MSTVVEEGNEKLPLVKTDPEESPQGHNKVYQCHICGQQFSRLFNLKRHVDAHHAFAVPDDNTCSKCGDKYTSHFQLMKHINRHRKMERGTGASVHKHSPKPLRAKFKDVNKCLAANNTSSLKHGQNKFQCHCAKLFKTRSALSQHLKVHLCGSDNICNICCKVFKQRRYLREHIRQCHFQVTDDEKLKCPNCHKQLYHRSSFYKHTKKCKWFLSLIEV